MDTILAVLMFTVLLGSLWDIRRGQAQTWPRHPCHQWGLKTTGCERVADGVFDKP